MSHQELSKEMIQSFHQKGYLHRARFLNKQEIDNIKSIADELVNRPEIPGSVMKYFERSKLSGVELLNRVEDFIEEYPAIKAITLGERVLNLIKNLTQNDYILFKDKLNFKLSGGGGFNTHQDGAAFSLFTKKELITILIPVDHIDINNGCLQVANNIFDKIILSHQNGKIEESQLQNVDWKNIYLSPGDIFIFSSFLIHRSGDNLSSNPRRTYYMTYSVKSEGELKEKYFNYKRSQFPPRIERAKNFDDSQWQAKLAKEIY